MTALCGAEMCELREMFEVPSRVELLSSDSMLLQQCLIVQTWCTMKVLLSLKIIHTGLQENLV